MTLSEVGLPCPLLPATGAEVGEPPPTEDVDEDPAIVVVALRAAVTAQA